MPRHITPCHIHFCLLLLLMALITKRVQIHARLGGCLEISMALPQQIRAILDVFEHFELTPYDFFIHFYSPSESPTHLKTIRSQNPFHLMLSYVLKHLGFLHWQPTTHPNGCFKLHVRVTSHMNFGGGHIGAFSRNGCDRVLCAGAWNWS